MLRLQNIHVVHFKMLPLNEAGLKELQMVIWSFIIYVILCGLQGYFQ